MGTGGKRGTMGTGVYEVKGGRVIGGAGGAGVDF